MGVICTAQNQRSELSGTFFSVRAMMSIYSLPTDLLRYELFPLLDRAERLCFSVSVFRFPFPKSLNSDQAKDITKHDLKFVRPFLKSLLTLEPEYLAALKPKFRRGRQPRLENALTLFAAYNDNHALINPKQKRQYWHGYAEGGKLPGPWPTSESWKTPLQKYGMTTLRLMIRGRNLKWLSYGLCRPINRLGVWHQTLAEAIREAGLEEQFLAILTPSQLHYYKSY
jgi:hypothetical protein